MNFGLQIPFTEGEKWKKWGESNKGGYIKATVHLCTGITAKSLTLHILIKFLERIKLIWTTQQEMDIGNNFWKKL